MKEAPIFIHSLFRSGSTYLFSLLRRSPEVYCYSMMHELVAWAADDVSGWRARPMLTRCEPASPCHGGRLFF